MNSPELSERRVFDRFPAKFPARIKDSRDNFGIINLRDASAQGIRIRTREKFFKFDTVTLEIDIPDGHSPMVIKGQVTWTKTLDYNIWDFGIKCHKIDLMQMARLYKFVAPSI